MATKSLPRRAPKTEAATLADHAPPGSRSAPGGSSHLVRRVVEPIVGRHVHPHMLRHSFASRLRAAGADLQLIQEALGHASIKKTTMYAHLATPARRQKLAELLTEYN